MIVVWPHTHTPHSTAQYDTRTFSFGGAGSGSGESGFLWVSLIVKMTLHTSFVGTSAVSHKG